MNVRGRTALALILLTMALALACDSNRSPTAPPPPAPGGQPSSAEYFGTIEVLSMGAPAAGAEVACVVRNVNADAGRDWSFSLTLPEGTSASTGRRATWASDLLATPDFTPANYAADSSGLELFDLIAGNLNRYADACSSAATRVQLDAPVLITLPGPLADGIRGEGTLKLRLSVAHWGDIGYGPGFWADFSGHAEIDVHFDLRRQ